MAPKTAAGLIAGAAARLALEGERRREGRPHRTPADPLPNPLLDAELLFRGLSGRSRAALLSSGDASVSEDLAARFEAAVGRRLNLEPVQYILGTASFWRDEFRVTPAVLIPRPDTELLVECVAARLRDLDEPRILDIGTGSGCIALSLLLELPRAQAEAVDVSEAALAIARHNARELVRESRVAFTLSRWLDSVALDSAFDAIVSNPPYVARADPSSLPAEVRDFEPGVALFAEEGDDLSSYRAILSGLGGRLKPGGLVAFEVGLGQADRVAELLRAHAFGSIEITNDLAGIARVVLGRRA